MLKHQRQTPKVLIKQKQYKFRKMTTLPTLLQRHHQIQSNAVVRAGKQAMALAIKAQVAVANQKKTQVAVVNPKKAKVAAVNVKVMEKVAVANAKVQTKKNNKHQLTIEKWTITQVIVLLFFICIK